MSKKQFTAPEKALAELSNDELAEFTAAAQEVGAQFADVADADLSAEDAEAVIAAGEFLSSAAEESATREAAATERTERLSAARAAMAANTSGDEDEDEDDEEKRRKEAEEAEAAAAAEASLTASARRRGSVAGRAAARAPKPEVQKGDAAPRVSLVAAADVKGVPAGKQYKNLSEASEAITSRLNSLPKGVKNVRVSHGALELRLPENEFSQANFGGKLDSEMLMQAANESRLPGGSLVAAGSWGAPSERMLDFCELESIGDLLQIAEVTIIHGGIQYTKGPTFADVFNSATGFWDMTEATAEAGTELKTSLRPEVPEFQEERLDAVGVMMEAGLLTRAGWPQLVERYASLALTAHQYKLAMKSIRQIQAFTGPAKSVTSGFGNVTDVLHVLELVATGERQKNAMAINATLEVLAPFWLRTAIRAALANRHGIDHLSITDAQIESWFAARNLKVQWLAGYQNLTLDANNIATAYPDTFETIMYPAGTYVRGVADVITLDTVYDSVNLKKNDYVHLFVEQGTLITNPCGEGQRLQLPLNVNGRLAADDITKSFNAPAPVAP